LDCWALTSIPSFQYSIAPHLKTLMFSRLLSALILFGLSSTWNSAARSQEVFIGNPGKSLNFFHFDLALEKGFFREQGLDVKSLPRSAMSPSWLC
jgi:ABC-type nitrate/sulfonate/bicarbonate transport system substrate-binding protein